MIAYVPSGSYGLESAGQARRPGPHGRAGAPIDFIEPSAPDPALWSKSPVPLTPWFAEAIRNSEAVERSAIAVENINGPVLMFSGTDDQMWPSLNLADLAVQRMMARNFAHPYEHVSYAGAGHFIRFPYSPTITEIYHPLTHVMMALGGDQHANHVANLNSWHRALSFLKRIFG